ncbi:hypothetical protein UFOVP1616_51 [uncultured Caudovirales phage]|uniref:Uncharacterized protein n=1 Tax=uncultured Caudovirales phage TaxID=2100421 RepID=A0A6J5SKD3_9CAUD|nr:hypothetical protein UFOVP1467_4 [uncultured Caudovirales phage]CAB4219670.1 hypothetical protein UFOVP1616_51 [uncultured Caudovirales phage]
MAKLVLKDAYVLFGTYDISDHVASVTLQSTLDVVETTAMGSTAKTRVAGLADNSLTLELHQDFAAGSIEAAVYPTIGTAVTILIKPVNAAVTATNPSYSVSALITEWTMIDGTTGVLATAKVTWPISGPITKATS